MGLYLALLGANKTSYMALASEDGTIRAHLKREAPLVIKGNQNVREDMREAFMRLANATDRELPDLFSDVIQVCVAMSGVFLKADRTALRQILDQIGLPVDLDPVLCDKGTVRSSFQDLRRHC